MTFLIYLLIPIIITAIILFVTKCWKHSLATFGIGLFVTALTYGIAVGSKTTDIEVWNGEVVSKKSEKVSCEHSYPCNCRPSCTMDSKGHSSCTTVCDTCYEHSHDIDWNVSTNIGSFTIDRVNHQGTQEPARWAKVKIGDPYSTTRFFTNYIIAVPESLFNFSHKDLLTKYAGKIPSYPTSRYDYQYIDRVITDRSIPDLKEWNNALAHTLKKLGPQRQANYVIILTQIKDKDYLYALRDAWKGGKKNDVVVIMSVPEYPKIEWVQVMSWSPKELFKVSLRDSLAEGLAEPKRVMESIDFHTMKYFERLHMSSMEHLKEEVVPEDYVIWIVFVLNLVVGGGIIYVNRRN